MKLLLDEQLSPRIAAILRDRGHEVVAVKEREEWVGLDDFQVLEVARVENRALVTNNVRDFRPLAASAVARGAGHPGVVFLPGHHRRTRAAVGKIADALETLLKEHAGDNDLASQEVWL